MEILRRPRRLRQDNIRNLVRETEFGLDNLVFPLFIVDGQSIKKEIKSMPGHYHYSVDNINEEIRTLKELGINSIILFGLPHKKDSLGSEAYNDEGVIQRAVREIKKEYPDFIVITDICLCEYTDHGHCGIINQSGYVKNDETLNYLGMIALSHVRAGADILAPSDMMDGRVGYIRAVLDSAGFINTPIMAYSAKYASNFYGPFREAAESAPFKGDRKSYQMDYRNAKEAVLEGELDYQEGADILMVKPALAYLDIIRRYSEKFSVPIAAYNVSGEYVMMKMAIDNGVLDKNVIIETITAIRRAGASIIITYFAKEIALMKMDKE